MVHVTPAALYRRMDVTRMVCEIVKGIPAGLVISLNAWAVSAWLKATILINSQPRWLFRKKRWSEGEMRAISCYYLVVAYLMLRVVRLTSTLTKRPGRPYGDFFRNTRPILGQVAIFSMATMLMDEFVMFYILRKFGLEKRRLLITGRPLDKEEQVQWSDDDCCICFGAMLDDEDETKEREQYSGTLGAGTEMMEDGINKDTDHVLENFCVVKQHVAHRGCIRKWYNYGPKGYRPLEAFRIFSWGTTLHGAVAGMNHAAAVGRHRIGLGWLLSQLPPTTTVGLGANVPLRIPLDPTAEPASARDSDQEQHQNHEEQGPVLETPAEAAEPVFRPLFPQQQNEYFLSENGGHKTCPACRQQLVLNFVDLAKGRKEMGYLQKLRDLGQDMTNFTDWKGLILRSLITAGWVGTTIVCGKLRIVAVDKAITKHQMNRTLATISTLAESSSL
ncbi:hypothetical protein BGZ65_006495 [Modicella reniformis]|uniref:Uncharacterized protein n=1 Tax=Modicella reniformis TaxID=1440133 RepID=A0A9P6LUG9_9FUNG|nr:hypothetical protein BGZ65_006495 [Modicella reniformis]